MSGETMNAIDQLVVEGILQPDDAADAYENAAAAGIGPVKWLVNNSRITLKQAVRATAVSAGQEFIDLDDVIVDSRAREVLDARDARRLTALPVGFDPDGVVKIVVSPKQVLDVLVKDELTRVIRDGQPFRLATAVRPTIENKIETEYRSESELAHLSDEVIKDQQSNEQPRDITEISEATSEAPITRMVGLLIQQAIADRASDIHVDPEEDGVRVRYRVDGVLHDVKKFDRRVRDEMTSRIKVMADLDVAERRKPQDGRLSVTAVGGAKIDLRLACLPTVHGEKIVMRILDNSNTLMTLENLGFSPQNQKIFEEAYSRPYGALLVTGPTGSGKSTTLYAALNQVARPEINVITVENPVEYRIDGISQIEVNPKAGMTFSAALRSILRADPDVVLIGEIRDRETGQIAMEAAMTGHLVMSTLHTNDAPSAITRLTEMDIAPFLVGAAVTAVLAQRLVRRLCTRCRVKYVPEREVLDGLRFPYDPDEPMPTLYRPLGCGHCTNGYRGRMGLHEVMPVDSQVERLAVAGASVEQMTQYALESGMVPLREDGWYKVGLGQTSIEEVLRVVI